ncbi:hypothetical protein F1880_007401 [Penicillium rolfsii]|nr:hypothetical protein F1880_007401 [Penicillium rolfsii]
MLNAHYAHFRVLERVSYVGTMLSRMQMSPWEKQVTIVELPGRPAFARKAASAGQALIAQITEAITLVRDGR